MEERRDLFALSWNVEFERNDGRRPDYGISLVLHVLLEKSAVALCCFYTEPKSCSFCKCQRIILKVLTLCFTAISASPNALTCPGLIELVHVVGSLQQLQ